MEQHITFMDKLIEGLLSQGLLGIIVVGMVMYVLSLQKKHEAERKETQTIFDNRLKSMMEEHRAERKEDHNDIKEIAEQSHEYIKESTGLMGEISSMLNTITNRLIK